MTFMEDHPEWYGTYSDYHPEIVRQKTIPELEEEVEIACFFSLSTELQETSKIEEIIISSLFTLSSLKNLFIS